MNQSATSYISRFLYLPSPFVSFAIKKKTSKKFISSSHNVAQHSPLQSVDVISPMFTLDSRYARSLRSKYVERTMKLRYMGQFSVINRGRWSIWLNFVSGLVGWAQRHIVFECMPLLRSRTRWMAPTTFIFRLNYIKSPLLCTYWEFIASFWKWNQIESFFKFSIFIFGSCYDTPVWAHIRQMLFLDTDDDERKGSIDFVVRHLCCSIIIYRKHKKKKKMLSTSDIVYESIVYRCSEMRIRR